MYMYMCVCMYVRMHACMFDHVCKYAHIHSHIRVDVCACGRIVLTTNGKVAQADARIVAESFLRRLKTTSPSWLSSFSPRRNMGRAPTAWAHTHLSLRIVIGSVNNWIDLLPLDLGSPQGPKQKAIPRILQDRLVSSMPLGTLRRGLIHCRRMMMAGGARDDFGFLSRMVITCDYGARKRKPLLPDIGYLRLFVGRKCANFEWIGSWLAFD